VAARIRLKPFDTLFEVGEAVRRFHVVESGCLLVTLSSQGTPTLIRLARAGDLVVGDVGGIRVTTCHAIEASTLLSVERKQMARAAACDGRIAEALRRVHERELETLLASGWRADVPSQIVAGAAAERTVASGAHGTPSHGRDAARGALEAIA
jgi:CRP-like cAMP-binding protein